MAFNYKWYRTRATKNIVDLRDGCSEFYEGHLFALKEIAELCGCSVQTIRNRAFKLCASGKIKLYRCLEQGNRWHYSIHDRNLELFNIEY